MRKGRVFNQLRSRYAHTKRLAQLHSAHTYTSTITLHSAHTVVQLHSTVHTLSKCNIASLLEKFWRNSLYVNGDGIPKLLNMTLATVSRHRN